MYIVEVIKLYQQHITQDKVFHLSEQTLEKTKMTINNKPVGGNGKKR